MQRVEAHEHREADGRRRHRQQQRRRRAREQSGVTRDPGRGEQHEPGRRKQRWQPRRRKVIAAPLQGECHDAREGLRTGIHTIENGRAARSDYPPRREDVQEFVVKRRMRKNRPGRQPQHERRQQARCKHRPRRPARQDLRKDRRTHGNRASGLREKTSFS